MTKCPFYVLIDYALFFLSVLKKERRKKKVLNIYWLCSSQVLTENKEYSCTTFPCTLSGLPKNIRALKLLFLVITVKVFPPIFIFSRLMIWQVSCFFPASYTFAIDAFGNPDFLFYATSSRYSLFWPSIMAVWTMHSGCVEKPQKALHIRLNELYLRLEMCRGASLFYFLLSLRTRA